MDDADLIKRFTDTPVTELFIKRDGDVTGVQVDAFDVPRFKFGFEMVH